MRYKLICFGLVLFFLTGTAAAQEDEGFGIDSLEMNLEEVREVNVTVRNELRVGDSINLTFKGRAFNTIMDVNVTGSGNNGDIKCYEDNKVCTVKGIDAKSSRIVTMELKAVSVGQEELLLEGKSHKTQLKGEDSILITTKPVTNEGPVSAPGITELYLLILAGLATGFYYFRLNK